MSHQILQQVDPDDAAWYRALTLTERNVSLPSGHVGRASIPVDTTQATRRIQRWRSHPSLSSDAIFIRRLVADDVTEEELFHLLGESAEAVRDRTPEPPGWLAEFARAFARPVYAVGPPPPEDSHDQDQAVVGFLNAVTPLIDQSVDRLRDNIRTLREVYPDSPFDAVAVEHILFANLSAQLLMILSRTLVLEMHVARLRGLLRGETPEERFNNFLQLLRQREMAITIFREYPVLAREVTTCISEWETASLEFLERLCADWEAIRASFGLGAPPGVLVALHSGGDQHRGGRSVQIAEFAAGFKVVYKPKALAVDVHFQELLGWLGDRGYHLPFRRIAVLDRGPYGWTEFIETHSCTSTAEVERFFERQGAYLALLYGLEATDFHFENLLAAGEHPVLVDLESLFQPRVAGADIGGSDLYAGQIMTDSVLRVGLLPQRLWANAESIGIDLSGLGGTAGQLTPHGVPQWEGPGTDEMRFIRKRVAIPGTRNRATLGGRDVDALDYAESIVAGFGGMYRLLLAHRDELLADDGPLGRFAGDEVRVILRNTKAYGSLLTESFHPDVLRDALDRDRLFDALWNGIEDYPYLAAVIPAERRDLLHGSIPMFTTRPSSRDVWSSMSERTADFFDETSFESSRRRIRQFSEEDLEKQIWFVRASLTTLAMGTGQTQRPPRSMPEPRGAAHRERLLAAARAVGDRLEMLALHGTHDVSWVGVTMVGEHQWSLLPLSLDLYSGLPGIALFLAHLGVLVNEERYTLLARATLTTLRRQVERVRSRPAPIGGFDGWGGVIYALAHLGTLWDDRVLLAEAEDLVALLPELIVQDDHLDIMGGAAGCIGSLLALHHRTRSLSTLAAARECGERLVTCAQPMPQGVGWWNPHIPITQPLTGFSHGASGVSWALLELASVTGEERFRATALEGIAYERSLFSPQEGNWADLRDPAAIGRGGGGQPSFMTTWCHGAPGIGIGRLRSLRHLDDAVVRAEIEAALRTTLAHDFGHNHSLCHGDLGNLELFLQAAEILNEPYWHVQANRIAAMVLDDIEASGWRCGVPLEVETPGLMTGLAGIGYGLLRLAEPTRIPAVLALAPPCV